MNGEASLAPFGFLLLLLVSDLTLAESSDREALLVLKSAVDPSNSECLRGRVTEMVFEYLNLTGTLDGANLNWLDQFRVLSFKGNLISGEIPDLSGLTNLKSLFLNDNQFSDYFPSSISDLQYNWLTGEFPPLNQTSLRFFNVSNNKLSGEILITLALIRFNFSSFLGNLNLCVLLNHGCLMLVRALLFLVYCREREREGERVGRGSSVWNCSESEEEKKLVLRDANIVFFFFLVYLGSEEIVNIKCFLIINGFGFWVRQLGVVRNMVFVLYSTCWVD
uniref:Uncharacterized protein n=1 Tax=Nelumbo nucifera TaxID=4432 RepID=A0A822ZA39_NELNU|nr:TPA_asm: hypothetical protein HUJ06_001384 [Nelumbo nucifera]